MANRPDGPTRPRHDLLIGLRSPGLALVAAASVLSGYKWLGLIPVEPSTASFHAFSRPGAVIFAIVAIPLAALLAPPVDGRHRPTARWTVLAAGGAVVVATVALVATHTPVTQRLLGMVDLMLALACVGALVVGERGVRLAARRRTLSDWTGRSLPFRSPN